jgi:hypothetical protein
VNAFAGMGKSSRFDTRANLSLNRREEGSGEIITGKKLMSWQVHYRRGDQQFCVLARDLSAAVAIASVLLRDGYDVVKFEAASGETIKLEEIKRLCNQ